MNRELTGIYTIWKREALRFFRERSRLFTSIITPLLWLLIFGTGLGSAIKFRGMSGSYQSYIFPGIIGMTILFSSIFGGISVIMDKRYGFLKEMFVAPISRASIVFGKTLGGSTSSVMQGFLILLLASFFGINISVLDFIFATAIMIIMSVGIVGIGLFIAAFMDSMEGFNLIMNFIVMPMFLLSGALFPINNLPAWLKFAVYLDPVTYGVDALRAVILGSSSIPLYIDLIVLIVFAIAIILSAAFVFTKREQNIM